MAKRSNPNGLTDQQQLFADTYLADPERNAARAYRAAYPNCKTENAAESAASRLLSHVKVAAYLDKHTKAAEKKTGITVERIMLELGRVALSDPLAVFDDDGSVRRLSDIPEDLRRAIASFQVSEYYEEGDDEKPVRVKVTNVRFWDKNRGAELAGKHHKMYTDRVEAEVSGLLVHYECNIHRTRE